MQQPNVVADYLDTLTRELSFDVSLSHRVRQEVEDHLWEAANDKPDDAPIETQRRVIANFGDPRDIARRYAASSLFQQTRRVGATVLVALTGVFLAMSGRVAWYRFMQWEWTDRLEHLRAIGFSVARYAFMLAFAIGVAGLIYIVSRRAPVEFNRSYRKEISRCVALCAASAGALLAAVIVGMLLTGLRLSEIKLSAAAIVPILLLTIEMTLTGALVFYVTATIRRMLFASSLLRR